MALVWRPESYQCEPADIGSVGNAQTTKRPRRRATRARTGCLTCRARRVKCDEGKPACHRCTNGGFNCRGYEFYSPPSDRNILSLPHFGGSKDSQEMFSMLPELLDIQGNSSHYHETLPWLVLSNCHYLPSRAGHHFALDTALTCTANGIRELFRNGQARAPESTSYIPKLPLELTRMYTMAIGALRQVLEDRRLCSSPEVLLAVILICCFETLKDNSEGTLRLHMYGLAKIYEHRGLPDIGIEIERDLLIVCLPLTVESCLYTNNPCFWSQKQWGKVILRHRDHQTMSRNIWFDDNWRIVAKIATLLADCSKFILCTTGGSPGYYEKRRVLKGQIQRVGKLAAKLRDIKVKELCDHDPAANIYTAYTKLSQAKEAKEGRVSGWEIHFLGPCVEAMIVCFILPTALGGSDALVHIENVGRLTEWLDLYEKRLPSIFFRFKGLIADLLKATLMTIDEWREFAAETEASAKQGKILVVGPNLFRRWLTLIGIKPRANQ